MTDYLKTYPKSHAEKISNIVETINDLYQMTPKGLPVCLSPNAELIQNIPLKEIRSFLEKLEIDEKVISITKRPDREPDFRRLEAKSYECYEIIVLPVFEGYLNKTLINKPTISDLLERQIASMINNDITRQKQTTEARQVAINHATKELNKQSQAQTLPLKAQKLFQAESKKKAKVIERSQESLFWITFDDVNHRVLLNDVIILAEPKPNSSAHGLIKALIASPNKEHDLASVCSGESSAAYRDLGFRKGLKNLFLEVGKGKIKLINPVSRERFNRLQNKEPVRVYFKP